jgi:hypothetical protein
MSDRSEVDPIKAYVDGCVAGKSGSTDLWPANRVLAHISPEDAGWVAGLVDGEGCIGLTAHKTAGDKDGSLRSHRFYPRCNIAGTSLAMLEEVQRVVGFGNIVKSGRCEGRKQGYVWHVPISHLKPFLQRITPILRLKKDQALLALVYLDWKEVGRDGGPGLPLEMVPYTIEVYHRMRSLNRRGTSVEEEIQFSMLEPKQADRTCSADGCEMRRYSHYRWCYRHWLQFKEPEIKNCEYCGKQMEKRHPRARFCNDRCMSAFSKDAVKGPDRKHRQSITEEQIQRAIEMLATGKYNQTSVAKILGVDRTSLGQILRGRARKDVKFELPDPDLLAKGNEIWKQQRLETGEGLRDATCDVCGKSFKALNSRMRLCGDPECLHKANNDRQNAKYAAKVAANPKGVKGHTEPRTLTCPICNNDFVSTHPMQIFCSLDCRGKARSQGRYRQ